MESEIEMVVCSSEMVAKHILDLVRMRRPVVVPLLVVFACMGFEP